MKKKIKKEWVGDFLYYSMIILYFVGKVLDGFFYENLWRPKISLIILLIRQSFLIILGIMAVKDNYNNKVQNIVVHIILFLIIIYVLWSILARFCGWYYPV